MTNPRILFLLLIGFAALVGGNAPAIAQTSPSTPVPSCKGVFDLCGYVDEQTQQERIPFKYEGASSFSEGLAGVWVDGRYGFIDPSGQTVIPPIYEGGCRFEQGLAQVRIHGKIGLIDQSGRFVIPANYENVGQFDQGLAEVRVNGKSGIINRQGEMVVEPQFAKAIVFNSETVITQDGEEKYGQPSRDLVFFDHVRLRSIHSKWVSEQEYQLSAFDENNHKYILASIRGEESNFGLLKSDGTWQIPPKFWMAQALYGDRAIVCIGANQTPTQKCGAVDAEGRMAVPLRHWFLYGWRNGIGVASENGKKGLLDKSGNLIGERYFDDVKAAWTGDVSTVLIEGKWVGLSRQGQIVKNPDNGKAAADCPKGMKIVQEAGKFRVLGADGQTTFPHIIDSFGARLMMMSTNESGPQTSYQLDCDRPLSVKYGTKIGLIESTGKTIAELLVVDEIGLFGSSGEAPVRVGKKWGLINSLGKVMVAPRYDKMNLVSADRYAVMEVGRKFWIDGLGQEQPEPRVVEEQDLAFFRECEGGSKHISINSGGATRWGLADSAGKVVVEPKYRAIRCFRQGTALVADDTKRQWCLLNRKGEIYRERCETTFYPYRWTHSQPEKLADDPYESSVLWMRALLEFGAGRRDKPPAFVGDGSYFSEHLDRE